VVGALIAMAAPEHDGKTFNVASGHAVSVNDLTAAMVAASGAVSTLRRCPPDWTAGSRRFGDTGFAASELGWKADTPIEVGLGRTWSALERSNDA
jgi:nucleoside-diphosphate-sugar epimerase